MGETQVHKEDQEYIWLLCYYCPLLFSCLSVCLLHVFMFVFLSYCFLPCDTMHKRGLCRRAVSVRLSVAFVYSVEMSKRILRPFFIIW